MNKRMFLALTVALLQMVVAAHGSSHEGYDNEKKVLVLSSYYQGYAWASALEAPVVSHYAVKMKSNVEVDYLDLVADRDSCFMKETAERLMSEHDPQQKRLVILIGEEAWIMYRSYMKGEWRELPCIAVFSGTYTVSAKDYSESKEITAEMEIPLEESRKGLNATLICDPFFTRQTLDLALQIKPESKHIALVSDTWQIGYILRRQMRELLKENYPGMDFIDLNNVKYSTAELREQLSQLPNNTTILFASWFTQSKGSNRVLYPDNAMRLIAGELTHNTVFGLFDVGIRSGALTGGVYPTGDELSEQLMKTIEKVDKGVQPRDMPLTKVEQVKRYLNYKNLQANKIPETRYPGDAVYYEKPTNFLERYEAFIWTGLAVVVLVVFLLGILAVMQTRLRRQTAKMLRIINENEKGKTRFINNMGNILRSPLNAIQMAIDMMNGNQLCEENKVLVDIINSNKKLLLNTFNDIIDLGKADTKQLELDCSKVDVNMLVETTAEALIHNEKIPVEVNLKNDETTFVNADAKRLAQVISYTALNADYYKVVGNITISVDSDERLAYITVACKTNYLTSNAETLFDVYNEKTNPAHSGRSNLELPLCRKLMKAMGGDIQLIQRQETWTFAIYMPKV